jgi:hypothetical protein
MKESKVIKPTTENQNPLNGSIKIFLAGSIEMGAAEDWQVRIEKFLEDQNVTIYNPRRDDWDSSWTQEESNPQFNYQVNWEISKLIDSDVIFMYLSPKTKSPISLLELGMFSREQKMIVCCPDGFWRKGNVEVVCTRFKIPMFDDFDKALGSLLSTVNSHKTW